MEIKVNATLDAIYNPIGPLYFVVYFSQNWETFHQVRRATAVCSLPPQMTMRHSSLVIGMAPIFGSV